MEIEEETIEEVEDEEEVPERILIRTIDDWITFETTGKVDDFWAEDSNLYPIFYEPNVRCFLVEARCRHTANGGASAAVTIEKLSNGVVRGSGGSMLESVFSLTSGANLIQKKGPTTVIAGLTVGPGDSIALRASGTLSSLRNVAVTALWGIHLKDIPPGQSATAVLTGL